jgi:hypothetical protein
MTSTTPPPPTRAAPHLDETPTGADPARGADTPMPLREKSDVSPSTLAEPSPSIISPAGKEHALPADVYTPEGVYWADLSWVERVSVES